MSTVDQHPSHSFARRVPPHRIIIARGEDVRTFTVRPWLVVTVAAVGATFAALYLAATGYLVFRDDLLAASLARQTRMQHAYEDRIAALRADIDRLTSRQLLNQEAVEARLEKLLGRQMALDTRQDIIAGLSQAARRAGLAEIETGETAVAPDETAQKARQKGQETSSIAPSAAAPLAGMEEVAASLDNLAHDQVAYVDAIADKVSERTDKIAAVLTRLGHAVPPGPGETTGLGGPFVGLDEDADPETFRDGVGLITDEIERYTAIRRLASQLPLSRPLANAVVTSPFGARIDPFLGKPAMHTGVDFRATTGDPILATAGGTVITAGYSGGYGRTVEIDHGHGITTRFAHMSRIDVKVGQVVSKGAVVGAAGSSGRSTGPHAHYEVRVDGAPINPMVYIKAGGEIAPLL